MGLDRLGQIEQPEPLVDVLRRLADAFGELLLVQLAGAQDRLERLRFLDRIEVEVLPVHVLVDGRLER